MKTFNENIFSDEDISQLADEILRIEYPIYDSTPQWMQDMFNMLKMKIEFKLRNWLATHNLINNMVAYKEGGDKE